MKIGSTTSLTITSTTQQNHVTKSLFSFFNYKLILRNLLLENYQLITKSNNKHQQQTKKNMNV